MALDKSGLKACECVILEDTEQGLKAAKNAGVTCVVIPNPMLKDADLSLTDAVLNDIFELKQWFLAN